MKSKLLIIQLTIFMLFCASCAKAQTLGAGISVDSQGNLVINAPLYVFDRYGENPKLELAPSSMNYEVSACIFYGEDVVDPLDFKGEIKKGNLSLTIKEPSEINLVKTMYFWGIPERFFTNGANEKIGMLYLTIDNNGNIRRLWLYPNRNARILLKGNKEVNKYYIDGENCEFFYSLGEVNIIGKINESKFWNWRGDFNLHLKQGWNIVSTRKYFDDTLNKDTETLTSVTLSKDAVWVLIK